MPVVNEVKKTLKKSVCDGLFPHAVLFEGEKGTGKSETALWLSQLLLCESENSPCGICWCCKKIKSGNHPDVTVILPEGKKTSIGIDDIRKIKETLYLSPSEGKRKIYIVPNADMMTPEAQNAFLKSLEEPPENVNFILTAANRNFLLDTIVSRTALFSFSPMTASDCADELGRRFPDADSRMIFLTALAFDGSIGAASEAVESGVCDTALTVGDIPLLMRQGKLYDVTLRISSHAKDRNELVSFLDIFKNIIVKSSVEKAAGRKYEISIQPSEAVRLSDIADRALGAVTQNCSTDLVISWFVLECAKVFGGNR